MGEERQAGTEAPNEARPNRGGHPFRAIATGTAIAFLLAALRATWRVESHGVDRFDAAIAQGRRALLVFWHGKYAPLFAILRDRRACIFSSESDRGLAIATICRYFGYACVRIPDGGGDESLRRMEAALEDYSATGIAADGPLGPRHKVKRGPVLLASRLGFEIFPASFAARPCLVSKHRWDRMELPPPFARVRLELGSPFAVPPGLDQEGVSAWSRVLHEALDTVDEAAREGLLTLPRPRDTTRPE